MFLRLVVSLAVCLSAASAEDWPQWRGPTADGVSTEKGLPVRWSASENVAWKAPLEGWGTSTPIVWGDTVFVTTQVGDGPVAESNDFAGSKDAARQEVDGVRFLVKAFDRTTGKLRWEKSFPASASLPEVHRKHNLASPSCVTDGKLVYAWFGDGQLAALTPDGDLMWRRNLAEENSAFDVRWGHGSSPTIYGDSLLLLVDHPGHSYLLATDKATGKDLWKRDRGPDKRSYTTPFVVEREAGGDLLLVNTNTALEALSPTTGETLWQVGEENRVPVGTPVYHQGVVYVNRGYNSSPYLATRVEGAEPNVLWRVGTGGPYVSSVVYAAGLLFMANERGIVSAVDAETGKPIWRERVGGVFSASPVVADGKVYMTDEEGKTFVIEAAREYRLIAENDLGERTLASPAIAGGMIFLRTDDHLWAIGAK
ncbi:MAG: PQQ-binding-like beta-propeller repeat protein [Acidobacteria bacterium]|nr:PQQ-binding-like beta-propeller repeat protein [Acidobacteriota bacterium]